MGILCPYSREFQGRLQSQFVAPSRINGPQFFVQTKEEKQVKRSHTMPDKDKISSLVREHHKSGFQECRAISCVFSLKKPCLARRNRLHHKGNKYRCACKKFLIDSS